MSDFRRIAAAARTLRTLLLTAFEEEPPLEISTDVVLIRTDDLSRREGRTLIVEPAVSLLLYRVELDRAQGEPNPPRRPGGEGNPGPSPQPLSLHFLATAWGADAEHEHHIFGRTLQVLQDNPVLSGSRLDPGANWAGDDAIRLVVDDVPSAVLSQMLHPYGCGLRLSIAIVARLERGFA